MSGSGVVPLAAAALGAGAALLGQLMSWKSGERRFRWELAQRDREAKLRYLEPLRARQLAAYEAFYELLQEAIEAGGIGESHYLTVRPLFAYVDPALQHRLVRVLTAVVSREGPIPADERREILAVQQDIQKALRAPTMAEPE
ncbi:MAG TPA: hypothetical protein VMZ11_04320 [Mycobacteriales bacterium]|nr:hypothetical protein [Mycobacteriales bacterium]